MIDLTTILSPELFAGVMSALGLSAIGNIIQALKRGDLKKALEETLKFFDYSSDSEVAPDVVRDAAVNRGMNLYQLTYSDRERIKATCANAVERQQVCLILDRYESDGLYEYTIETTGASYYIEQGWIAAVKTHDVSTSATGTLRPVDASGNRVGACNFLGVRINGNLITGGAQMTSDELVGAEMVVSLCGTARGQVIIGGMWDSSELEPVTITVNEIGEGKNIRLRLPQYLSKMTAGEHWIAIRCGSYAGHDAVAGDVIEWAPAQARYNIVIRDD